jgi:DNA invertase Pin-like site-specific DNA recombinase
MRLTMERAVIYVRVSTKEQTLNLSLATQKRECIAYCNREGWEIASVFVEEGESAKTADRTELKQLLSYCHAHRRELGYVVVYDLSRFSRNTEDHLTLRAMLAKLGIRLRSATLAIDESPMGQFVETIFSGVAQLDNGMKTERTVLGMRAALELGKWTFQAPVGYRTNPACPPSLIPDPDRAPLVAEVFNDFAAGRFTKSELLRRLGPRGLVGRKGKPLTPQTLDAMLRNPLYAARLEVPKWGISVQGDFEPIVPLAVYERAQRRLSQRAPARPHVRAHGDFPLRGLIIHDECGRPMTASWSRGRSGRYAYYHCPKCRGASAPKDELESRFSELLARLQPRPEYLKLFRAVVVDVWRNRQAEASRALSGKSARAAELRQRLEKLEEAFIYAHAIDESTYRSQRDKLRAAVSAVEDEIDEARAEGLDVEGVLDFAESVLSNAAQL